MNTPPEAVRNDTVSSNVSLSPSTFTLRQIVVDRFEILAMLGTGGSGEVWHAYDLKLRVEVALKSLRLGSKHDEELVETVRREVRTAREVISPNVCRIFDLVVNDESELISMEYIDGITLMSTLIKNGPMSLQKAGDVASQFLSGLEAIHKAGFVHCDLKPENIMITRTGRVVVMDFGIAKPWTQEGGPISGTLPYMSPEQLSGMAIDPRSDIYSAGIILAEMIHPDGVISQQTREAIWETVRSNPRELAESPWKSVIARAVDMRAENRFDSAGAMARALEEATQVQETAKEQKPYPGLAAFTAMDVDFFLGREFEVETQLKKLQRLHLTALIGPSGAGKTSLLRAGLIPALPEGWSTIFCVPGDSPMVHLGQALVPQLTKNTEAMRKILEFEDADVALDFFQQWKQQHAEALLIVDRFEELFTLNSQEVQNRFASLLGRVAMESGVRVLLSMRDDFLFRCHSHPELAPIFSEITPLGPPAAPALRRALAQPALKCGYRFEDETLVDDILADVDKERGALPLMAFAAFRLWQKRDRNTGRLTRQAYQDIGGVAGALAQHAEETIERIGSNREPIVREIFRNLITAESTRVARNIEELMSLFPEPRPAEEVLHHLIDARLLTSFEAQGPSNETERRVEIIHESLLSAWPRLLRWQIQDADTAQFRDQLRQAAQLWQQRNRPVDLLWTGTAFREFQVWKERYPGSLSKIEKSFAEAMVQSAERKRRTRRLALIATFVALLVVLALISFFWRNATVARDHALSEANRAEASKLLTMGRAIDESDPSQRLAFAIASLERADTLEGREFALLSIADQPPAHMLTLQRQPYFVAFSPDGNWLAAAGGNGLELLPASGKTPILLSNVEPTSVPRFSADSRYLIAREDRSIVKIWSISEKKLVRTFQMDGETSMRVSHNGMFLITSATSESVSRSNEAIIRRWKWNEQNPVEVSRWSKKDVASFDINWRGDRMVYHNRKSVYIRSIGDSGLGEPELILNQSAEIQLVTSHPKWEQIAFSDGNGQIQIWSIMAGDRKLVRLISAGADLEMLFFDPSGKYIYAMRGETEVLLWDLTAPEGAEPMRFNHEFATLAMMNGDGSLLAIPWRSALAFHRIMRKYPYIFRSSGLSIRFAPDGETLFHGAGEGLRSWSLDEQRRVPSRLLWKPPNGVLQPMDIDPSGQFALAGTNSGSPDAGVYLITLQDGKTLPLKRCLPVRIYDGVAFSVDGRFAAAVGIHEPFESHGIEIWDLQTGKCRVLEQSSGMPSFSIKFGPENTLFSGDNEGNLYRWDLKDDSRKLLAKGKGIVSSIAITQDGRYLAATILSVQQWGEIPSATSELVVHDLSQNKTLPVHSHGNRVFSVTFDPAGTRLVTGGIDGIVRVGAINDERPHELIGHDGVVADVAVHPDGQWIASTGYYQPTVRLWRMPAGKNQMTVPIEAFLRGLHDLTNARVVADKNSTTGYRFEYAPFTGWWRQGPQDETHH